MLIAGGCGGSNQGQEVRNAQMEQVDERAEAQEDAVDRQQSAREERMDERYDKREDAVSQNQPGEGASQDLVQASKDRAEYKSNAKARLDKLGVRLNAAQEKLNIMGAKAPATLKSELQTSAKEYENVKQDVMRLDQTPPDNWEGATSRVEEGQSELEDRIDKLEDKIDDVE